VDCIYIIQLYCENFDKADSKLAFFIENIQLTTFNSVCQGSAIILKHFHHEIPLTVLFVRYNSFIFENLNNMFERIIPVGIPMYLENYHTWMLYKKYESVSGKDPTVLTLDDLGFGFILWLGACGISIFGFFMEILRFKLRKVLRNLIGLWIFLKILLLRLKTIIA